jgi:large subunit ribosomal protein L25
MKQVSLSGSLRASVGKTGAKADRKNEMVPAVLYGGAEQKHINVPYKELHAIIYSPDSYQVNVEVEGKTHGCIIREIQYHPVSDRILHVDFLELVPNKAVTTLIPVRFTGTSVGVRSGGKLVRNVRSLKIRATPEKMPDYVSISIDKLDLGNVLKVKDIVLQDAIVIDSPNRSVVAVKSTRNVASPAEAAKDAKAAPAKGAAAPAKAAPAKK